MAHADLVASLREAGVNRGDLVALVVTPALGYGLAAAGRTWAVPGVAAEVGRADEALRPRWVTALPTARVRFFGDPRIKGVGTWEHTVILPPQREVGKAQG